VNLDWEVIRSFIQQLGVVKGTFVVFFWTAHAALFLLYRGRLKDRQKEIDRLAAENKEHRDRFTALLDKQFKIPKAKLSPPKPQQQLPRGRP
jgi:hypothetical protein